MAKFRNLFLILIVVGLTLIFYKSRAVPQPGDDFIMTSLPDDVRQVLSAKTGPGIVGAQIRIPIFLYHYVEYIQDKNDTFRAKLNITPNVFISQIQTLKDAGFTFITPADLTRAISGKKNLPKNLVILSFDDGYMDFYTDVFPILKKENVKAIAYIVPDFLNRPNYMFGSQLVEIAKNPLIEIGSHTVGHVWLKDMDREQAEYQIAKSRKMLQEMLDLPIESFAYPYGAFDLQAVSLVEKAGFKNAVSTLPGINQSEENKFFLYRLRPGLRTGQELINFVNQETFKAW